MNQKVRLTSLAACAGCAAKFSPGDLRQLLAELPLVEPADVDSRSFGGFLELRRHQVGRSVDLPAPDEQAIRRQGLAGKPALVLQHGVIAAGSLVSEDVPDGAFLLLVLVQHGPGE